MPVGLLHNSFWARSYFLSDFFPQCFWVVQDWQPWRLNHSVLPQHRGQVGAATGSCSDRKLLKCKSLIWWVHFLVQPVLLISPDWCQWISIISSMKSAGNNFKSLSASFPSIFESWEVMDSAVYYKSSEIMTPPDAWHREDAYGSKVFLSWTEGLLRRILPGTQESWFTSLLCSRPPLWSC